MDPAIPIYQLFKLRLGTSNTFYIVVIKMTFNLLVLTWKSYSFNHEFACKENKFKTQCLTRKDSKSQWRLVKSSKIICTTMKKETGI